MPSIPQSVEALASLAMKHSGASGYAIYETGDGGQPRRLLRAAGAAVPEESDRKCVVVTCSLRPSSSLAAMLALVWTEAAAAARAPEVLQRLAIAIEQVWRLSFLAELYAREAARIGALELELADSKIADRARGLLAAAESGGEAIETIVRHVESVVQRSAFESTLGQFGRELERQIAEREITSRAKAVLQDRYGLSEEQAHVHLRVVSRTTRKRLRDVAQSVIANPVSGAKGLSL